MSGPSQLLISVGRCSFEASTRRANRKLPALFKQDRAIHSAGVISYLAPKPAAHCAARRRTPAGSHISHDLSLSALVLQPRRRPLTGARIETGTSKRTSSNRDVAPSRGRGSKHLTGDYALPPAKSPPHGGADRNDRRLDLGDDAADLGRPLTGARIETTFRQRVATLQNVAPSRGRGSKHGMLAAMTQTPESPPHGGADRNHADARHIEGVHGRPLTGARIETPTADRQVGRQSVAPSRGRGSKPRHRPGRRRQRRCRPLTGARIETDSAASGSGSAPVAPSRGRGSKHYLYRRLPARRRGRPLAGARIETRSTPICSNPHRVAPSRGRGSKPRYGLRSRVPGRSPPHGGADRNSLMRYQLARRYRRPLTGARIETR